MKSKGLEELEKLGNEYPSEGDTLWSQYSERFSIIEKELKEYEQLKQLKLLPYPQKNGDEYRQDVIKRLKVLEIIKENAEYYDWISIFASIMRNETYCEYLDSCECTKETSFASELEYDLLKEVLK